MLLRPLRGHRKSNFRLGITYPLAEVLTMTSRVEFVMTHRGAGLPGPGFLVFQDIGYRPAGGKIQLDFRFAIFDTDSYDERIYAYERDVLYAYSAPAFFDRGTKIIGVIKYPMWKWLVLWFKCSRIQYMRKKVVGSGFEAINGNAVTHIRFQLQFKF